MYRQTIEKQTIQEIKEKMEQGLLPQWILTDPSIYEREQEKIFARTWQFLAHDSELPEPGSYVTRWIVDDPILVVRTNDGEIKAFLNSCPHRGTMLCTADFGKKKSFLCPYHGWSFNLNGDLIGVVAGDKVYGEEMKKDDWGLRPIAQVAAYQGMIFATLDPDASSLEEYLGGMKWYLDILLGRSGGMEVRGLPQRWVVNTNWKLVLENFSGDPYHVQSTHRSTVELGISPKDPLYAGYGHQVVLENGHGINVITAQGQGRPERPPYQGLPEEMWPLFESNLSKEQLRVFAKTTVFVGSIYPTLSFNSPVHGSEGHLHNYLNFRVWRPLGPDKIEIWSWFMIDKAAPDDYKEDAYKGYISSFGPSGTLEQDDTEIWTRVAQTSKGYMARNKVLSYNNLLNYLMGFERVLPDENFPGPGIAYPTCYLDAIHRATHEHWLELISRD
ncbi:aromatic ring-hydroxylating oxygenase subunit alpha [Brevibacillus centrosporus]|uniref:Phenylpropionate dioxygenase, large terminal subunit n=1 Tax=Brevibacillus centrosporus TaxID=54910 RepID=A0A1I3XCV4_9BACL|nr:aromatic ring-hydroxylating dioxygenase subunit alpha [Brevibacillus centrosporus]MEC2133190.1 aromatic ring-hydroxylating dioxygenase subunit alpha [Brevibacillus centrosporus]MED4910944.1 aromatic ring-hydroxylating dioxygenase subunit alpha [Brevibacillus centrosporus]RNB64934.1 aromatic ring-hydroxylating dioxygenase subunit alpha [Brevibacillus centrosporus]SFK17334.1 Phenylpropionate dioxygenase, large terminal subunit [Brevibacillus centrosporus]GED31205.1 putative large terminal sub